jgi:hypothetical protein
MKGNIIYKWGTDHLLVELGNRTETRIRVLFWGEFLFTTGMATILMLRSYPFGADILNGLIGIFSALLYILASYRFLMRMFSEERILLNGSGISLIRKTIFRTRVRHFDWNKIGPLQYAAIVEKTAHPLKGNSFDYFGFETHEHLVQKLHNEGNLYFNFGGYPIHFARNVYSWHAEEMVRMMKLYAGEKLHIGAELRHLLKSDHVE